MAGILLDVRLVAWKNVAQTDVHFVLVFSPHEAGKAYLLLQTIKALERAEEQKIKSMRKETGKNVEKGDHNHDKRHMAVKRIQNHNLLRPWEKEKERMEEDKSRKTKTYDEREKLNKDGCFAKGNGFVRNSSAKRHQTAKALHRTNSHGPRTAMMV